MKRAITALLLLLTLPLFAAPLTITPNGTSGTTVTAGVPFAACTLTDIKNFKLVNDAGVEVPVFIKQTLAWPTSRCDGVASVRAVKIQFRYDAANGSKIYDWSLEPRASAALVEAAVQEVASTQPGRVGIKEPAFYAINDPAYLVTTGLIPPTTVVGNSDYDTTWFPASLAARVERVSLSNPSRDDHLFDAVSTLYQQALRSGNVEYYRQAYLEHEFYMSRWVVTPQVDAEKDTWYVGTWSLAEGDIKFVYLTPMKLHLALTGDDTWQPSEIGTPSPLVADRTTFIKYVAYRATGINGIGKAYTDIGSRFTEREAGFGLQQLLAAYELTNDATILANIKTAVSYLYNMMTANPDGRGNAYLSHSWEMHEGFYPAFIGKGPEITGRVREIKLTGAVADDYTKIPAGAGVGFYLDTVNYGILASAPIKNVDGTLTLKFTAPVAVPSNAYVRFGEAPTKRWTPVMNFTADRVFSVWMQAIAADALWQVYNLLDDPEVKRQSSEILLNFGRSVVAYGIDGNGLAPDIKTKIETAFGVKVQSGDADGSRRIVPHARYVASPAMAVDGSADYINYMNIDGSYSDQHSPEALFQISVALRFETDPAKKAAMEAVVDGLTRWFASSNINLTIAPNDPTRKFSWGNKSDPWGAFALLGRAVPTTQPLTATTPLPQSSPVPPPANVRLMTGDVWGDDDVPAGSIITDGEDGWTWVTSNPTPHSGTKAHKSIHKTGMHQHFFDGATTVMQVAAGDVLYSWIYLDPANPPNEIMLQFNDGVSWEHRAYWGVNAINPAIYGFGVDGTSSHRYMGPLPAVGQWVKLEVPAESVGLVGLTVRGMAFTLSDGIATWDSFGKTPREH